MDALLLLLGSRLGRLRLGGRRDDLVLADARGGSGRIDGSLALESRPAVRKARAEYNRGVLDGKKYDAFLHQETERAIRWQEEAGLDMLVHGEFERNDMVQYFGEKLAGFAFTVNGWEPNSW